VNLLPSSVTDLINISTVNFVPTVLALIGFVVPVGIALWVIGFAIRKGLQLVRAYTYKAM